MSSNKDRNLSRDFSDLRLNDRSKREGKRPSRHAPGRYIDDRSTRDDRRSSRHTSDRHVDDRSTRDDRRDSRTATDSRADNRSIREDRRSSRNIPDSRADDRPNRDGKQPSQKAPDHRIDDESIMKTPSYHAPATIDPTQSRMSAWEYLDLFWSVIKFDESDYNEPSSATEGPCEFDCKFVMGGLESLVKALARMNKKIQEDKDMIYEKIQKDKNASIYEMIRKDRNASIYERFRKDKNTSVHEHTKRRRTSVSGKGANDDKKTDQQGLPPPFHWWGKESPVPERNFVLTYITFVGKYGIRDSRKMIQEMFPDEMKAGRGRASDRSGIDINTKRYYLLLEVIFCVTRAAYKVGRWNVANFDTLINILEEPGVGKAERAPPPPTIEPDAAHYERLMIGWHDNLNTKNPRPESLVDYSDRERRHRK